MLLWLIASNSSVFFLFIQRRFIFSVPLGSILSLVQPRFNYNTYHTSSVITGMCGAKAGVIRPRRIPLVYILLCINVFFWPIVIFFSSGRGSFLLLSAPWHAGSPPGPRAQVWALVEVRSTCSVGSMWQVPSGMHSDHVEPPRCMQTQEMIKRMSGGSCDIWDLECHQCRQTLLSWR